MLKRFAIIGVAGYIAPRHLKAIQAVGGEVVAAYDPHDAVGVLDAYFPNAAFFTEYERFDRHLEKLKRNGSIVDYVVVCSPNYLHDAHCRFGLRYGANVICEKPLVLRSVNAQALMEIQQESLGHIFTILQLRLHPEIQQLKKEIEAKDKIFDIELTYLTPRGSWYYASWKGDESKSGGVATNIGIHFFDMLIWIFGKVQFVQVHQRSFDRVSGYLKLEKATIKWYLSIARMENNASPTRKLIINGRTIDFSSGFDDLHLKSYEHILHNQGFGIDETIPSIELVEKIRTISISEKKENRHPFYYLPLSKHPFE